MKSTAVIYIRTTYAHAFHLYIENCVKLAEHPFHHDGCVGHPSCQQSLNDCILFKFCFGTEVLEVVGLAFSIYIIGKVFGTPLVQYMYTTSFDIPNFSSGN